MLTYAVINAFVMTAEYDQVLFQRKLVGHSLIELFPVGRGIDDFVVITLVAQMRDDPVYRFNLQYHTRRKTKSVVVYPTMSEIGRIIAQRMNIDVNQLFVSGSLDYGAVQGAFQKFRQNRNDINA